MTDARTELANPRYLPTPAVQSSAEFSNFLETYRFGRGQEPTNAAPGLSDHGQMKAVDFIIYQGGKKVADIKQAMIKSRCEASQIVADSLHVFGRHPAPR